LEVSPDGTRLALADFRQIVLLEESTLSPQGRLEGLPAPVTTMRFSHDGTLFAAGTGAGTILVWDVASGKALEELHAHAGPVRGLAFSPDDGTLYSSSDGLFVWDLRGDRRLVRRIYPAAPGEPSADHAFAAPDGTSVAYVNNIDPGRGPDTIQFRDVTTGELGDPVAAGHTVSAVDWRPSDNAQFAAADDRGVVRVWAGRSGELIVEREVAEGSVGGIAYTRDGQRIVIGERSGAVFQVDAETLEPVGERVEVHRRIRGVLTAPGEHIAVMLLAGDAYASIDLVEGTVVRRDGLGVDPSWLDISPDGALLAVGAGTGEVGLIALGSGEWVQSPIDSHGGWVRRVAYAPDGATFASSGDDGQVTVWDGRTGEQLATLISGGSNRGAVVEFQADGHTLLVAGRNGAVHTIDTRVQHWIDRACDVAGRNLTHEEWAEAIGGRPYRETCPAHAVR
jgi:WD40 repeat protein